MFAVKVRFGSFVFSDVFRNLFRSSASLFWELVLTVLVLYCLPEFVWILNLFCTGKNFLYCFFLLFFLLILRLPLNLTVLINRFSPFFLVLSFPSASCSSPRASPAYWQDLVVGTSRYPPCLLSSRRSSPHSIPPLPPPNILVILFPSLFLPQQHTDKAGVFVPGETFPSRL